MGIRGAVDRRFSQFIGGAVQSIIPLLDRRDAHNNILQGRLHLPSIANLFGTESFHHPITNPWEHMLTNINYTSNLPNGIQQTWSHLQLTFQEVATPVARDNRSLLINQPMANAGFYDDGSSPGSITNVITSEIESARSTALEQQITSALSRKNYERWSWEAWSKIGASFLISPPDAMGYIRDEEFMVILSTYLGQPDPIISPLAG